MLGSASRCVVGLCAVLTSMEAHAAPNELQRMEQAIEQRVSRGEFMGAVLVARGGKPVLDRGYGKASLEWGILNSPATRFRLGSITKQFTAASILLLEERGILKTDDRIKKYLPDAPAAWDQISIFNLLTHTSGIPDLTAFPDFEASEALPTTPERTVARFREKPLEFEPGTKFAYSNSGYILLGYLLEKITGETYQDFVQKNIFDRLGMKNSGYDSSTEVIPHHAEGYTPKGGKVLVAGYVNMSLPFSAGGLYSTTEDLLLWEEGLYGGKLLSPESVKKMTTPFLGDPAKDYAFGVVVTYAPNGAKTVWHSGSIEGFDACMVYGFADRLAVIVLSNLNGDAARQLSDELRMIARNEGTPTDVGR